jgi:hypothetical protein
VMSRSKPGVLVAHAMYCWVDPGCQDRLCPPASRVQARVTSSGKRAHSGWGVAMSEGASYLATSRPYVKRYGYQYRLVSVIW